MTNIGIHISNQPLKQKKYYNIPNLEVMAWIVSHRSQKYLSVALKLFWGENL
jgi:hypothetical protein